MSRAARPVDRARRRWPGVEDVSVAAVVALGSAVVAAVGPIVVVLGLARLLVFVVLGVGTWLSVRRLGVVDLSTGGVAAVGAYAGGVWPAIVGLPAAAGLVVGASAGAVVGAASLAVAGRVGRIGSAVTTLAFTAAATGLLSAVPAAGGVAGYHAVPLVTGSDRADLAVVGALVAVTLVVASVVARRSVSSSASVAVRAPAAGMALARRPSLTAARAGLWTGAIVGLGGAVLATTSGSVAPATFRLALSVSLLLAVAVGGRTAAAGALGAALLFGPSIVWPTAPVLGDAPLLILGPVGLLILALRPEGLVLGWRPTSDPVGAEPRAPEPSHEPRTLELDGAPLVGGRQLSLTVDPGQVAALVGPNGSGKSTLLARIGGQLPDRGSVRLGGEPLPADPVARARAGIARTFQRAPDVRPEDLVATARSEGRDAASAIAWAQDVLGDDAATPSGAALVAVAARRPRVALLDEPAAHLGVRSVARFCRGLAEGGCVVLIVEHRPELVAGADVVIDVTGAAT